MKQLGFLLLVGAWLLAPALARADDAFVGWSDTQLKVKILQLQQENAELKAKLAAAPAAEAAPAKATADLLLDDFEGPTASNGQSWWTGCDANNLGTTIQPQPFSPEKGGSPLSPGHSGRIHGHYGKNQAPWPWANLTLALAQHDIRSYRALRFYVKGDTGRYRVLLCRSTVKDFGYHSSDFDAPAKWTLVTLPLSDFVQPSWAQPQAADFKDIEKISFSPTTPDQDYDLGIDDLTLVK
jgi:hypothetical protein